MTTQVLIAPASETEWRSLLAPGARQSVHVIRPVGLHVEMDICVLPHRVIATDPALEVSLKRQPCARHGAHAFAQGAICPPRRQCARRSVTCSACTHRQSRAACCASHTPPLA